MSRSNLTSVIVAVVVAVASVACSRQSPAAPSIPGAVPSSATQEGIGAVNAQPVEGSYILYLANTTGQVVSSLPVAGTGRSELLLWAQVRDSSGSLAPTGTVILEVCRRGGGTSTWRPSAECDSGAASWRHVSTVKVDEGCFPLAPETGNACRLFGGMRNPITVGFRYRYIGQGSDIANGVSASQDMTWIAIP
jgi:hypothetical protein